MMPVVMTIVRTKVTTMVMRIVMTPAATAVDRGVVGHGLVCRFMAGM